MTPLVVDSSVAMKWFVPEVLSDRALRLLDGTFELFAPDLLMPECGNVVWKKVTRGQLNADEARAVLRGLGRAPLRIVGSPGLLETALEIAVAFQRSVYDSLYVALAMARECVLITADHRLAKALAAGPLGPNIRSLGEWDQD